jgi:hypothetical protein
VPYISDGADTRRRSDRRLGGRQDVADEQWPRWRSARHQRLTPASGTPGSAETRAQRMNLGILGVPSDIEMIATHVHRRARTLGVERVPTPRRGHTDQVRPSFGRQTRAVSRARAGSLAARPKRTIANIVARTLPWGSAPRTTRPQAGHLKSGLEMWRVERMRPSMSSSSSRTHPLRGRDAVHRLCARPACA